MSKKTEAVKKPEKVEKAPEQPPKAEVKPEKPEKPETAKREKRRREEKGIFTLYKVEADKVLRLRPTCERCGTGYFMADHGNRYTCGHCGFTRYKPAQNEHV
jgi:small subunit ribosomal protein S27Ae